MEAANDTLLKTGLVWYKWNTGFHYLIATHICIMTLSNKQNISWQGHTDWAKWGCYNLYWIVSPSSFHILHWG